MCTIPNALSKQSCTSLRVACVSCMTSADACVLCPCVAPQVRIVEAARDKLAKEVKDQSRHDTRVAIQG